MSLFNFISILSWLVFFLKQKFNWSSFVKNNLEVKFQTFNQQNQQDRKLIKLFVNNIIGNEGAFILKLVSKTRINILLANLFLICGKFILKKIFIIFYNFHQ